MDDMTEEDISLPEGVQVPFEFYPQLYTVTAKQQLIKHIITKRRQAHKRLKTCLHEIQHLKNFQGKDIVSVLDSGINFMEFDNDEKNKLLLNSLKSVKEKISDKLRVLKDEYRDITNKLHKEWNLSHPEYHLIESAKQMGIIDEPYLLIMVTISPYFYFIRDKRNMNQWTLIQSNTYGTDFQIINDIDEAKVEEVISKYTTRPNQTPIMFNYCKRSHINSDENISEWIQANEGCKKFMEADEKWFDENILNEEDNNSVTSDLIDTT